MITITRAMDGYDIAQEIRMERQALKKFSFLLLEGDTDVRRFERHINSTCCSVVNCYGRKRNAIEAIELLYDEGFPGALAVVDTDFDRIMGKLKAHEGIIYSEGHDLDIDWVTPDVIGRYLVEVGDKNKSSACGSSSIIIDKILIGLKPVSVAKLMNEMKVVDYKLSNIDVSKCFVNFGIDIDEYVKLVFDGYPPDPGAQYLLKQKITSWAGKRYDLRQITNGHDFHCALGACLRNELGSRAPAQTWGSEVESHLRLTHDEKDFKMTAVYAAITTWTKENSPFRIVAT